MTFYPEHRQAARHMKGLHPSLYENSKLRDFFDSHQDMQASFKDIRNEILIRGSNLIERWEKEPPLPHMDSGSSLWSRRNLDIIANDSMSAIPKGDIFLYLGEGVLRSGKWKAFWFFLPRLMEDNYISMNMMMYIPVIDSIENIGIWANSLHIPDLRERYFQIMSGIPPKEWEN
jgi:hypothetical protein